MPDEVKDVPAEGAQEPQAPPVPDISAGSEQGSSAQPGVDVSAIAEAVISQLDPILADKVDARFKSGKDVRFSKVDEIYEWVKASGGDVAKIQNELTVSELRNRLAALEGDSGKSPTQAPQEKSLADKTAEFLTKSEDELGVTLNREELAALSDSRAFTSEDQWYQAITTSLVKKAKSGVVTPAATVGTTGSVVPGSDNEQEALTAELTELYAGTKGSLSLPHNSKRLKEISARLDEIAPPTQIT
jgi:hypothetical protein